MSPALALRPSLVASVLVWLAVSGVPADAAVAPVVASGVVSYSIVKEGVPPTCAGDGPFVVTYDSATRRLNVAGSAIGCAPIFSLITGCEQDGDSTVACDKTVGEETIRITLAPDGTFDYLWDAPDFREEITGRMARQP